MFSRIALTFVIAVILIDRPLAAIPAISNPATVSLDKPLHFVGTDGSDVLVAPGTYAVEATESRLRLVPREGKEPLVIQAQVATHHETVSSPLALSIPVTADAHLLLLALPGGNVLHAVGSVSGVRTRGGVGVPDFIGGLPGGISWPNRPGLAGADPTYQRFTVGLKGVVVLDGDMGLSWTRQPSVERTTWTQARNICATLYPDGQSGWRLPTFLELASLVGRKPAGTLLPASHPFTNVQPGFYWSATTDADRSSHAWRVGISVALRSPTEPHVITAPKIGADAYYWCVRGGSAAPEVY